ncbi:hypothetical protein GE061_012290 [Apolygus lucorum]|uniref:Uncharacterized protein n=1 Tax=Apolygus lucorum TaxID=248454 RepID=A0A8S9XVZ3_APOLU|nr:hypothetical protein GE061_012290 [Apolygus lucorum]
MSDWNVSDIPSNHPEFEEEMKEAPRDPMVLLSDVLEKISRQWAPTQQPQQLKRLKLPDFDPSGKMTAKAWIKSCDLIIKSIPTDTAELAVALVESLKGLAGEWFADIVNDSLTWESFSLQFSSRFCETETPIGAAHTAITTWSKDGDITTYGAEQLLKFRSAFRGKTGEECAIIMTAACCARQDEEVRKWGYMEEEVTELLLQKKLQSLRGGRPINRHTNQTMHNNHHLNDVNNRAQKRPHYHGNDRYHDNKRFKNSHNNFDKRNLPSTSTTSNTQYQGGSNSQKRCWKCDSDTHSWRVCFRNPNRPQNNHQQQNQEQGGSQAGRRNIPTHHGNNGQHQERKVNGC